ncbi:hypothetical protein BB561_005747 [Smittium simulii]|uniref:3-methyl-2-oxobutanoate hydroxymethyltransferase n=1 Tax=Smittium simulii TaxID=133385 RepID=A0A2T9Y8L6_9FUNG|nr:hypothetical protein BB561_005747 [Smittium simulii]
MLLYSRLKAFPCISSLKYWKHSLPYSSFAPISNKKTTLLTLQKKYQEKAPISMITAYDYPTGLAANNSTVDTVLVGDSLAMTCLGYSSTHQLSLDTMIHHCAAVSRALSHPFLIADLPFGSYNCSNSQAINSAIAIVQKGQAECVKLEGGSSIIIERINNIVKAAGIPVCAHIGLTPQYSSSLGGFKVQGKTLKQAQSLFDQALALQNAGVSLIVLEAVPEIVGKAITRILEIPTIGIGAGRFTSGQVLVISDIVDINNSTAAPKFVKKYASLGKAYSDAINQYAQDVSQRIYPDPSAHNYAIPQKNEDEIKDYLLKQYLIQLD